MDSLSSMLVLSGIVRRRLDFPSDMKQWLARRSNVIQSILASTQLFKLSCPADSMAHRAHWPHD